MPELPEVEYHRQLLERCISGCTVKEIYTKPGSKVILNPKEISSLISQKVGSVHRWGKQLWLHLGESYLLIHLGMTGDILCSGEISKHYKTDGKQVNAEKHLHFKITFASGMEMSYYDTRMFGRIQLADKDPTSWLALGPDPLTSDTPLGTDTLTSDTDPLACGTPTLSSTSSSPIKAVLLDQHFVAGLGNWMVDEVLCEAGVHPQRSAASLSEQEWRRIWKEAVAVSHLAVAVSADSEQYPSYWLFHLRWQRKPKGEDLSVGRIAGRTTLWRPSKQRLAASE